MTQQLQDLSLESTPISSPHPDLQALLPRLATISSTFENKPVFDELGDVVEHLEELGAEDEFHVVPKWQINHNDLTSSTVTSWTYVTWLN